MGEDVFKIMKKSHLVDYRSTAIGEEAMARLKIANSIQLYNEES